MTYRDKFKKDTFGMDPDSMEACVRYRGYSDSCPCKDKKTNITPEDCSQCWDREIPEKKGRIQDSGERQEFATGAVRDIQKGKGRFDLVPLDVAARIFAAPFNELEDDDADPILLCIGNYQNDKDIVWIYSALGWVAKRIFPVGDNFKASVANMLLEVAIHYEEGAEKYEPNNWRKGIPVERYLDSGTRHYMKWLRGDEDEPHNRAVPWNLICLIWEAEFSPRAKNKED